MIEAVDAVRTGGLSAAGGSDPGLVRTNNEDRFYFNAERGLFLVVDGVGGHAAGEVAASIATQVITAALDRMTDDPERQVREAIALANNEIHDRAERRAEYDGMACVLTAAIVTGDTVTIGHVGDSRLYKLTPRGMSKLTHDHSPVGAREDEHEISEADAMSHPRRNEVFRDVGGMRHGPDDADFIETVIAPFGPEDALLLCSDGLSDMVLSSAIERIVRANAGRPADVVSRLIAAANDAGGKDNVTVVYVEGARFAAAQTPVDQPLRARAAAVARAIVRSRTVWAVIGLLAGLVLALAAAMRYDGFVLGGRGRTLVVGGDASEYRSIAAAMQAARRRDVVTVEPGEYAESVVLTDGVELRAAMAGTVTLVAPAGQTGWTSITAAGPNGGVISGLRIEGRPDAPVGVGVAIGGGAVVVEDLAVEGNVDVGISVRNGAPVVRGNRFADVRGLPITIAAGTRPIVRRNLFIRDGEERGPAVHVQGDARPVVVDNTFVGYQDPVGAPAELRDRAAAENYRAHLPAPAPRRAP